MTSTFPTEITTNKRYIDYKVNDIRCYFEIGAIWTLSLESARKTREYFTYNLEDNVLSSDDLNIYFITQKCVRSNSISKGFEDITRELVERRV